MSDTPKCSICNWVNVGLLNLGEPNELPVYMCHGCIKNERERLERENNQLRADNEVLSESCAGLEMERQKTNADLKQVENKLAIIEHATNDAFGSSQGAYHENALQAAREALAIVQNALKEK